MHKSFLLLCARRHDRSLRAPQTWSDTREFPRLLLFAWRNSVSLNTIPWNTWYCFTIPWNTWSLDLIQLTSLMTLLITNDPSCLWPLTWVTRSVVEFSLRSLTFPVWSSDVSQMSEQACQKNVSLLYTRYYQELRRNLCRNCFISIDNAVNVVVSIRFSSCLSATPLSFWSNVPLLSR